VLFLLSVDIVGRMAGGALPFVERQPLDPGHDLMDEALRFGGIC